MIFLILITVLELMIKQLAPISILYLQYLNLIAIKKLEPYFYYTESGCFAKNLISHSGTCPNVSKDSGIMIIMPDDINRSLVKATVNIYEKSV
jgi:hypothetical protein